MTCTFYIGQRVTITAPDKTWCSHRITGLTGTVANIIPPRPLPDVTLTPEEVHECTVVVVVLDSGPTAPAKLGLDDIEPTR